MSQFKDYVQAQVRGISKELLLPRAKAGGMKDFIKVVLNANQLNYAEAWHGVIECSEIKIGGYLKYNGNIPYMYCGEDSSGTPMFMAAMESYDKYLCSDGKIRFVKNDASDERFKFWKEAYEKAYWDNINASFESMGMRYNDQQVCWINRETGEEGCY